MKRGFRPYQRTLHLVQEVASLPPVAEEPIRRCEAMMRALNRRLGFTVAYSHLRLERLPGHPRSPSDV